MKTTKLQTAIDAAMSAAMSATKTATARTIRLATDAAKTPMRRKRRGRHLSRLPNSSTKR